MERVVLNEVILVRYVGQPDGSGHWVCDGKERCRVVFDIPKNRRQRRFGPFSDASEWGSEKRNGREVFWWTCLATRADIRRVLGENAEIVIRGAAEHNLKRIDLTIPRP